MTSASVQQAAKQSSLPWHAKAVTEHHSKLTKSMTRCASISTVKVHLMDKNVAHWSCEVKTDSWVKRKQLYIGSCILFKLQILFTH